MRSALGTANSGTRFTSSPASSRSPKTTGKWNWRDETRLRLSDTARGRGYARSVPGRHADPAHGAADDGLSHTAARPRELRLVHPRSDRCGLDRLDRVVAVQ